MTEDRKRIARILMALAEYYDKQLTETQLSMFVADLEDLDPVNIEEAAVAYRRDPKNTRFPLPASLRAALHPETDENLIATDLAGRMATAIESHGYTWDWPTHGYAPYQSFEEAVEKELGTLAYAVIQRFGGWKRMHDWFYESDRGQFNAQLRERIAATIRLSRVGRLNYRPQINYAASDRLGREAPRQIMRRPEEPS